MTVSSLIRDIPSDAEVARELLQYEVVRSIFVKSTEREIALKGGFAMRALFGSARHTKDIDLQHDARRANLARTRTLIRSAIRNAVATGILEDVRISEPKQTDTVARWKIGGRTAGGSQVALTIEVSRRPMPGDDCLTRMEMQPPAEVGGALVMVDTYSADAMAGAKTIALLSENRLAPRDLWDLDILITMRAEPPPHMIDHLRTERARQALFDKLDTMSWKLFREEVLPTLPAGVAEALDQDAFEEMKIRVALAVEKWLTDGDRSPDRRPDNQEPGPTP